MLAGRFHIPAAEVAQWSAQRCQAIEELIHALIAPAAALARPAVSSFHVGYA